MVLVEKLYAHLGVAELYTNGGEGESISFYLWILPLAPIYLIRRIIYYMKKCKVGGKFLAYYVKKLHGNSTYKMMKKN